VVRGDVKISDDDIGAWCLMGCCSLWCGDMWRELRMQVCMEEFACFQISKGADPFELHVQGSEAWIYKRGEASRAELEGSIDVDVYTCNWSNLVGHGCRRLRCKTSDIVWQR
jgi:hypothetical protein